MSRWAITSDKKDLVCDKSGRYFIYNNKSEAIKACSEMIEVNKRDFDIEQIRVIKDYD